MEKRGSRVLIILAKPRVAFKGGSSLFSMLYTVYTSHGGVVLQTKSIEEVHSFVQGYIYGLKTERVYEQKTTET